MKTNEKLKQLLTGICLLCVLGFFSGCAATGTASDSASDTSVAGTTGKKGRKAKKEETYSPAGVWEYTVEAPNGGGSGIMRVTGQPGNFEVVLETEQFGELRVYDLDMSLNSMNGKIDVSGFTAEIEGDFDEDEFVGYLSLGDEAFPMEAVRTSK